MSTIPSKEPAELTAGDSTAWNKTLSDYPATSHTLTYRLVPLAGGESFEITASANGSAYAVSVTPATTKTYEAGEYVLTPVIKDTANSGATTTVTLESTRLTIKPPAESQVDRRTEAEITLSQLKDTYRKLSSNTLISATVAGRTYNRYNMADLRKEIIYWENQVQNENGGSRKYIAVQFSRPS